MLLVLAGIVSGFALGFFARWGRFCTLGAIEDWVLAGNSARIRMWLVSVAIAIVVSFSLDYFKLIDISSISYVLTPVPLFANFFGGIVFGIGMALVGTCGFGMLARLGGGDLKSVFTFFALAIGSGATMWGLLSPLRKSISSGRMEQDFPASFAYYFAENIGASPYSWGALIAVLLLVLALYSKTIWRRKRAMVTALVFGLIIPFAWWASTNLYDDFNEGPVVGYSFIAPITDTLLFLSTSVSGGINFAIASVFGVIVGAGFGAKSVNQFRWEVPDSAREIGRQTIGGILMGFGGVLAFGCTIGQGFSAASLLAFSAPISFCGIFLGAWLGLLLLVRDDFAVRLMFWRRSP